LRTQARDAKEREDHQEIDHGAGGGDQDFIAAAKSAGSSDVCAAEPDSAFAYRDAKLRGCEHVTRLVKQKAREQERT